MLIISWLMLAALTLAGFAGRFGRRAAPLALAYAVTFVLAPALSVLTFGDVGNSHAFKTLVVTQIPFAVIGAVGGRAQEDERKKPLEAELTVGKSVAWALIAAFVVTAAASIFTLVQITGGANVTNAYDLNVAYSEARGDGSFGMVARVARLSIPFAVLCFAAGLLARTRRDRVIFFAFAALFTLELVSVKRSILFYTVAALILLWMTSVSDFRKLIRAVAGASLLGLAGLWFFGALQVATHKSAYDSAWESGLHEGATYISGNIPYAALFGPDGYTLPPGNSFPYFFQLFSPDLRGTIEKPFGTLPDGKLFNTSPGYFDVWNDFGWFGLILFALGLAFLASFAVRGRMRTAGSVALTLLPVLFLFRSNVLGELDVLQALVVYPFLARAAVALCRKQDANRRSPRRARARKVSYAQNPARGPVLSSGRRVARHTSHGDVPRSAGRRSRSRRRRTGHRRALPNP